MKPFIVVSDGFDSHLFQALLANPSLQVHPQAKLKQEELKTILPQVEGLIVRSATKVTADFLQHAPKLKLVIRAGEGVDNIDLKACAEKGVKVANTPGANSLSAAEHAIALMFTLLRKTAWAHNSMIKGEWEKTAFTGMEMSHKTIGIVGFGRIGQIVAKRLSGFEPKILFYDSHCKTTPAGLPYAHPAADLREIFSKCDIITLHLPYLKETHHLIDKNLLQLMPKHAFLVNASRGNIVVEEDLYEILKENKIRGAALDVFAHEPLEVDSKLRSLPNIILTPHLGASTDEAQFRVGEMAVHQIKEFFLHQNLLNEVKASCN